ncbi:MAG: BufA2 family periplasmic bufferin-type metallophore [Candidatus Binatia bacterium]
MKTGIKGALLATAVAGLFLASSAPAEEAPAAKDAKVKCYGVNACKGHGGCGGAGHACAGQNECKGKGFVETSAEDCKAKGGRTTES